MPNQSPTQDDDTAQKPGTRRNDRSAELTGRGAAAKPAAARARERNARVRCDQEGARLSLSQGHWLTGAGLAKYGVCLFALDRYDEAEATLLEAISILERALGSEHKQTVKAMTALADLYEEWGRPDLSAQWRAKLPQGADEAAHQATARDKP